MKMKLLISTCLLLFLGITAWLGIEIYKYFYTDPDCSLSIVTRNDLTVLKIEPNEIVNGVISVLYLEGDNKEIKLERTESSDVEYVITPNPEHGKVLKFECHLQYDRIAPSATRVRKQITMP